MASTDLKLVGSAWLVGSLEGCMQKLHASLQQALARRVSQAAAGFMAQYNYCTHLISSNRCDVQTPDQLGPWDLIQGLSGITHSITCTASETLGEPSIS